MNIHDLQQMSQECRGLALPYAGSVIDLQEQKNALFTDPTNPDNPLAMCPYFWSQMTTDLVLRRCAINHPEFVPWRYAFVTPLGITLKSWSLSRLGVLAGVVQDLEPLIHMTQMTDVSHIYDLRAVGVLHKSSMVLGETTYTSSQGRALTHPYIRLECSEFLTNNELLAIALHEFAHIADIRNYEHPAGHDAQWQNIYGTLLWLYLSITRPNDATDLVTIAESAKYPPIYPTRGQAEALIATST